MTSLFYSNSPREVGGGGSRGRYWYVTQVPYRTSSNESQRWPRLLVQASFERQQSEQPHVWPSGSLRGSGTALGSWR
jgi:hypothetical protein